jgi:hypothetical protein
VTDGRFKLIRFYEPDVDEWELYDVARRPQRTQQRLMVEAKLSSDEARLMRHLKRLRKEYQVPEEDPPASFRGGKERYLKGVEQMKAKIERLGLK